MLVFTGSRERTEGLEECQPCALQQVSILTSDDTVRFSAARRTVPKQRASRPELHADPNDSACRTRSHNSSRSSKTLTEESRSRRTQAVPRPRPGE